MAYVSEQTTEVLSLQARLEQMEAAITECHMLVSEMRPEAPDAAVATPSPGAENTANRCMDSLLQLLRRLRELHVHVGAL